MDEINTFYTRLYMQIFSLFKELYAFTLRKVSQNLPSKMFLEKPNKSIIMKYFGRHCSVTMEEIYCIFSHEIQISKSYVTQFTTPV